eukprot:TRINITY_DN41935_c0_g1_i1.p1 TRINITY_DN41935_c0_g1~~TRINITY_DN41935_c0_g1_i1.p1  ORF type:complete len:190 (-),score=10.29 TRINITY_DN41935_c0_g1_i1:16-564(-)
MVKLNCKKCVLVGHSYGCLIAMEMVDQAPDMMDHIVLMSPVGVTPHRLTGPSFFRINAQFMYIALSFLLQIPLIGRSLLLPLLYRYLLWLGLFSKSYTERSMEFAIHALAHYNFPKHKLNCEMCQKPVSIIHSEDDDIIPVSRGRELHQLIPGSDLLICQNGAHQPQTEPSRVLPTLQEAAT